MKKIVFALALLSSTVFALDWMEDIHEAFVKAKSENKPLMVFVESKHCRWCKKMNGRTLTDEGIEKRLQMFVPVKVMREDISAMAELPKIDGVPTVLFMKPNKDVVQEVLGYVDVDDFNSYINDAQKKIFDGKVE